MKKCPFCSEEIQNETIKCRYCGEYLNEFQHTTDDPPIKKQLTEGNRDRLDTLPNKPYSMSQSQKALLVAVIAVLVAMIAYPPFHLVGKNGVVFNTGYGWIFDPPKRGSMTATVNISMLLIQWIGVLVVGGIAFFLTKGASLTQVSSPQQSIAVTPPVEIPKEEAENLYENILGEKNRIYYLTKFKEFDRQPPGLKASWNWAAFFGGGAWVLYRKMYGWFFVFSGIFFIAFGFAAFLEDTGFPVLGYLLPLGTWIAYTLFANSIYHSSMKKKIAVAQISIKDRSQLLEFLRLKGGVHTWVIWVFTLLPVAGILAAIAIPNFIAYKQRTHAAAELEGRNKAAVTETTGTLKETQKAAEKGEALAQNKLGEMYAKGEGVTRDYKEAAKWFTKAAEQGDAMSQTSLGLMYYVGGGVTQNYKEAAKWFTKAAEQGDAMSQTSLGSMYYVGDGVTQNDKEAVKWYTKAAEQGDADAQTALGRMHDHGDGVTQNDKEAVKWYTKAAEQGDADAQTSLGWMYANGIGVMQDYKKAIKWHTKAAEQGDAKAQKYLGAMYANGTGITQNYKEAYKWWNPAAAQGDESARQVCDDLIKIMTPEQIAEAQRLSREFTPKK